ncbi:MAG: sugar porter family MFS transporter [Acidobacteria bacterium]|jgi:sugar porter (SP) family MFS transporter|nr:sugar porter family MFS transporter [Acidobacteriota bacterium]
MSTSDPAIGKKRRRNLAFIYFFGAFGGILFGYDIGVMTGALPILQQRWNLQNSPVDLGLITSAVMLGAILGGAMAGRLADRYGRRRLILIASLVFIAGAAFSAIAPDNGVAYLVAARIILGWAVGAASALVPAYLSEMAPADVRGRLSGLNQVMIVTGMLLSYVADFFLDSLSATWSWRIMLGAAVVPAIILFLGTLELPESPRFLVSHGLIDEARQILTTIRPERWHLEDELQDIRRTVQNENEQERTKGHYKAFLQPHYRPLIVAGLGVAALQQFQGANAIFYYLPLIVQRLSGASTHSALMWPMLEGAILVLGSLFFLLLADNINRRTLLTVGGIIMAISFIAPALLHMLMPSLGGNTVVVFLSIYVALYSFTWAPLTWVIVGEIFPLSIRGSGTGLASSFNWIGSFLVGLLFPIMASAMSEYAVFAIFGAVCVFGVIFIRLWVPETRGRTLEEIEARPETT